MHGTHADAPPAPASGIELDNPVEPRAGPRRGRAGCPLVGRLSRAHVRHCVSRHVRPALPCSRGRDGGGCSSASAQLAPKQRSLVRHPVSKPANQYSTHRPLGRPLCAQASADGLRWTVLMRKIRRRVVKILLNMLVGSGAAQVDEIQKPRYPSMSTLKAQYPSSTSYLHRNCSGSECFWC